MKALLIFLAILLIAAGVAVGLMNIFSPGTVIVGLNLDVAATLFTGGCVLLGLGVVAGNLSDMARHEADAGVDDGYAPVQSTAPDLPDFMAPVSVSAGSAAAGVATGARAFEHTEDQHRTEEATQAAPEAAGDIWDNNKITPEPAEEDAAGSIFGSVARPAIATTDKAIDTVKETAVDASDKARDDVSSFFAKPGEAGTDREADTAPATAPAFAAAAKPDVAVGDDTQTETSPAFSDIKGDADAGSSSIFSGTSAGKAAGVAKDAAETHLPEAKAGVEEAAETIVKAAQDIESKPEPATESTPEALPQEDELFVVEERIIRQRPARLLSDGTVEAETDEGWMRFENVEHVEEYLDAMKATA